jgi:hypothetical protein
MCPIHLGGTGESFAANSGGRMPGTSEAALVALLVYAVGYISSFWLPEPREEKLPE